MYQQGICAGGVSALIKNERLFNVLSLIFRLGIVGLKAWMVQLRQIRGLSGLPDPPLTKG